MFYQFRDLCNRHAGGECYATAARGSADANCIGIADLGTNIFVIDTQHLSCNIDHRGAAAANIRVAGDHSDGAILVDVQLCAGLPANIKPEPASHTPSLVGSKGSVVVWVGLGSLQGFHKPDLFECRSIGGFDTFRGGVLQPEFNRIYAKFIGQFVQGRLNRMCGDG